MTSGDLTTNVDVLNRRCEVRQRVPADFGVSITTDPAGKRKVTFRPIDISDSGLGIWTKERLLPGQTVFLHCSRTKRVVPLSVRWFEENHANADLNRCGLRATAAGELRFVRNQVIGEESVRRQDEELQNAATLMMLGRLTRDLVHDMGNGLMTATMQAEQLDALLSAIPEQTSADVKKWSGQLRSSLDRLQHVFYSAKSYYDSRLGKTLAPVSVREVLQDVAVLSGPYAKSKGIELDIGEVPEELHIYGMRGGLIRVFLNFIMNACTAIVEAARTDGAAPQPCIHIRVNVESNGWLVFAVENSGPKIDGLTAEQIPKLDGRALVTDGPRSNGLGLTIIRGILEEHGGQFFLDTKNSHTRFVVYLPRYHPK